METVGSVCSSAISHISALITYSSTILTCSSLSHSVSIYFPLPHIPWLSTSPGFPRSVSTISPPLHLSPAGSLDEFSTI